MNEKKRQYLLKEIGIEKTEKEIGAFEWIRISESGNLSEVFLREFQEKLNWYTVSKYQKMSESFIRKFDNNVDWHYISYHRQISESIIREFQDKVDWFAISKRYGLSEDFIEEFKDEICWKVYLKGNYVDFDIIKKYIFRTDFKSTEEFNTSHLNGIQKQNIEKLLKLKNIFQFNM